MMFPPGAAFHQSNQMEKGPAKSRASISFTFAVGFLHGLGRFACLHSASVAAHSLNAPCPLHDRPCRVVQRQPGETSLHFRGVQRLCCDRYLPFRLRRLSSQCAATNQTPRPFREITEWCDKDFQKVAPNDRRPVAHKSSVMCEALRMFAMCPLCD
jgi:hypothetical protein